MRSVEKMRLVRKQQMSMRFRRSPQSDQSMLSESDLESCLTLRPREGADAGNGAKLIGGRFCGNVRGLGFRCNGALIMRRALLETIHGVLEDSGEAEGDASLLEPGTQFEV